MAKSTTGEFVELLELLGRRWTLRLLWELREQPLPFNQLRAQAGGLSQSVLVTRLGELAEAGLVTDSDRGYRLTAHGSAVARCLGPLDRFAAVWSRTR